MKPKENHKVASFFILYIVDKKNIIKELKLYSDEIKKIEAKEKAKEEKELKEKLEDKEKAKKEAERKKIKEIKKS